MSDWLDLWYAQERIKMKNERCGDPWAFTREKKETSWPDCDWTKKDERDDDPWAFARGNNR